MRAAVFYTAAGLILAAGGFAAYRNAFMTEPAEPAFEIRGGLTFFRSESAARDAVKASAKPLFVDFAAVWCEPCKEFDRKVETDARLREVLSQTVLLRVMDTDEAFASFESKKGYEGLSDGLPFFVIESPDGTIRLAGHEWKDTEIFAKALAGIRK